MTAWEPPRRFAQEVSWEPGGDRPPARLAAEWLVAARDQPAWAAWLAARFPAGPVPGRR